jgi:hypothetical protein
VSAAFGASVLVNLLVWMTVPWLAHSSRPATSGQEPREVLVTAVSVIRIERRVKPRREKPQPRPQPQPEVQPQAQSTPEVPSLSLPSTWAKQDMGNEGLLNVTLWLDWKKQSGAFVPRIFMWRRGFDDTDQRAPSLKGAVDDILGVLHDEGATIYASRPQQLCDGTRDGWFLSYDKTHEQPPIHIDDTLFVAGDTIYRATYVRPAGQAEDQTAREALNTLC